jgi:hypothetical protein
LCGEDEGGVSTFSLGTEIRIMARPVHKNLIRKYQRKKQRKKMGNIFLTVRSLSLFLIVVSSGATAIGTGGL